MSDKVTVTEVKGQLCECMKLVYVQNTDPSFDPKLKSLTLQRVVYSNG